MKYFNVLALCMSLIISLTMEGLIPDSKTPSTATLPEWAFASYVQGDNDLYPYATYNILHMISAGSTKDVNVLVELDKPSDKVTYRYQIALNGLRDIGSLGLNDSSVSDMGTNPGQEIFDFMANVVRQHFPAKKYIYNLWNHGNGVLNQLTSGNLSRRPMPNSPFAIVNSSHQNLRGILYDYTQKTYLSTPQLGTSLKPIAKALNKNIDVLCMDACCMAMIEVAYEIKDSANILVASQQTEPVYGWPYDTILGALIGNPTMPASDAAKMIVQKYNAFYSQSDPTYNDPLSTLSAIDLTKISAAAGTLSTLCQKVLTALQNDSTNKATYITALQNARAASTEFAVVDYIDLYSFYLNLEKQFFTLMGASTASQSLITNSISILQAVTSAKVNLTSAIIANERGPSYNGNACGLSIYFPKSGGIPVTPATGPDLNGYMQTAFAQNTLWVNLVVNAQATAPAATTSSPK